MDFGSAQVVCEHCQQQNSLSVNLFIGLDYRFKKDVMATCRECNRDFIATLDDISHSRPRSTPGP